MYPINSSSTILVYQGLLKHSITTTTTATATTTTTTTTTTIIIIINAKHLNPKIKLQH